jgi:hypothetical protein
MKLNAFSLSTKVGSKPNPKSVLGSQKSLKASTGQKAGRKAGGSKRNGGGKNDGKPVVTTLQASDLKRVKVG